MEDSVLIVTGSGERPGNYVEALKTAGLPAERTRVLTPETEPSTSSRGAADARRLGARAAGVVVCGGGDPHPSLWGEEPLEGVRFHLEEDRDALEREVLTGAREARTPVFGVCRGMQMLNVFLGGDLWQHLPHQLPTAGGHYRSRPADALVHPVETNGVHMEGSSGWLRDLLAREATLVNSRHHQGVRRVAPELEAVGWAPDGLVEAISHRSPEWWLHGVQWHPENLLAMAQSRRLWRGFVEAVLARDGGSDGGGP